ncbi:hypothetical protein ACE1TF_09985 [Geomicrobium sp. JSM 1781026]|uniref:hypothetical protein n=1 Tax=Geomicrobium sp. JSM 1781026 TaxID=3344580 RepID=UPI0035C11596
MAVFVRDYIGIVRGVNREFIEIHQAQRSLEEALEDQLSETGLSDALQGVSGVLSLFFGMTGAGAVASAVFSMISTLSSTELETILLSVREGRQFLADMRDEFVNDPDLNILTVELPFLEYDTPSGIYRVCQGRGTITGRL